MNYLPHILGYIGVLCLVLSFQVNDKKNIMLMQAIGRAFFIGQYVLLAAFEAVAVTLWLAKGDLFYLFNFSYIMRHCIYEPGLFGTQKPQMAGFD